MRAGLIHSRPLSRNRKRESLGTGDCEIPRLLDGAAVNPNSDKVQEPSGPTKRVTVTDDSAESCRAKANALLQAAIDKPLGEERALLERSAAAWSMRADQLYRSEARGRRVA
jgi:hypothetical protein